jgi:hypothetical protein
MRELSIIETRQVSGGEPTVFQLSHRHAAPNRVMANDANRIAFDLMAMGYDYLGPDIGLTTNEREIELSASYEPIEVEIIDGVGYASDGMTTLYDDDGDGAWDSAMQSGADGYLWVFEQNGWTRF